MVRATRVLASVLAVAVAAAVQGQPGAAHAQGGTRIVAVGDIHGAYEGLTTILRAAGLLGENGRWTGGATHLIQTGDYLDRGERVRDVLDLLMRLEDEAEKAGGRADILMGNHEVMNLLLDLRDVSPRAFAAFADDDSASRRRRAYRDYARIMKRREAAALSEAEWNEAHPPGFVEYVDALGPRGQYGRWLRDRKVVIRAGDAIFMHAGLSESAPGSLDEVNRTAADDIAQWDRTRELLTQAGLITPYFTLRETLDAIVAEIRRISAALDAKQPLEPYVTQPFVTEIQTAARIGRSSLLDADGPLWFRGYALWPETEGARITALLERYDAQRFVTGHTPVVGSITPRFDGRVVLIDTGMLATHFQGGRPSALEITGDTLTAIYPDGRSPISKKDSK